MDTDFNQLIVEMHCLLKFRKIFINSLFIGCNAIFKVLSSHARAVSEQGVLDNTVQTDIPHGKPVAYTSPIVSLLKGLQICTGLLQSFIENITINVYPNPTNDFLNVTTSLDNSTKEIYSIAGVKLFETTDTTLDVRSLEAGVYFIKINGTNKLMRFIKR